MHTARSAALRRRGGTSTWVVVAVVVAIAALCGWKLMSPAVTWHETVDAGLDEAEVRRKPVLLLFTAGWCPPCQKLKRDVLSDGEVKGFLAENFVLVRVDLSSDSSPNHEVALEHDVESIPTIKAFTWRGQFIADYDGPRSRDHVLGWLQSIAK